MIGVIGALILNWSGDYDTKKLIKKYLTFCFFFFLLNWKYIIDNKNILGYKHRLETYTYGFMEKKNEQKHENIKMFS